MNLTIKSFLLSVALFFSCSWLKAQNNTQYSLQQLIDSAIYQSHLVSIKNWQIQEKISKLKEDNIKRYPYVTLGGNYQHNFSLAELTIPAGAIGVIPVSSGNSQSLPGENTKLKVGQHANYSTDVSLYQPILQQAKIKTGLGIDKIDIKLSETEKIKLTQQLTLSVRKLYYGILIAQKQQEEATTRLKLAEVKLQDAQVALTAGKTIVSNLSGLHASVAEEEQNVLKLDIMIQDYKHELANVTNIDDNVAINLQPLDTTIFAESTESIDIYRNNMATNIDLQITQLNKEKALLGIRAAKQSNLPDIGLIAGYYYQKGNPVLPTSSPYIGINLKWNLQDLFSNHHIQRQREAELKQAEYYVAYQQQQLRADIDKAYRKITQAKALMNVAKKALRYRQEEFNIQQDKQQSGLDVNSSTLEMKANLAKSEADFYAAHLSCLLAVAELKNLVGE